MVNKITSFLIKATTPRFLCGVVAFIFVGGYFFSSWFRQLPTLQKKRIALLTPTTKGEFHRVVMKKFMERASQSNKYAVKVFDANGPDKALMASMVHEVIEGKYNLCLSIGIMFSQVTKTILSKAQSQIPHIFTGTGDPLRAGLVERIEKPTKFITGLEVEQATNVDGAKLFHFIKPDMKHILIPYWIFGDGGKLEKEASDIQRYFTANGVKCTLLPVENIGEIIKKVSAFTLKIDSLMYLDGCIVQDAATGIIKLCNQYGITLFSPNLAGVKKGAAAGYGSSIENLGTESFNYADWMLSQEVIPSVLPVKILPQERQIGINTKTALTQGLTFSTELSCLLRGAIIYDPTKDKNAP